VLIAVGIVIDASMMNRIFSTLVSFLVAVVPIILALVPPAPLNRDDATWCELSVQEMASIRAAMLSRNGSCTFNMTISEVLAY
jgi:hypothetical protein